jgi:hypothetical protein
MNWFIALSLSLPIGGFVLLAIGEWRDRNTWWKESAHESFFQH